VETRGSIKPVKPMVWRLFSPNQTINQTVFWGLWLCLGPDNFLSIRSETRMQLTTLSTLVK
jgi:hypothetical protein